MALAIAGLLLCICGCKKKPTYDLSSPEATLASFEKALDQERIPEDISIFVSSPREIASWKLRCRTRGCSGGTFKVLKRDRMADYTAVLIADYTVQGKGGSTVMRGQRSPIQFAREDSSWLIEQFGKQIKAPARRRPAASARDAAPAPSSGPAPGAQDARSAAATE